MSNMRVASRSPYRPTFRAALIKRSTSAGVKYSRVRRAWFFGFVGGNFAENNGWGITAPLPETRIVPDDWGIDFAENSLSPPS
jgi:hypothetical protein